MRESPLLSMCCPKSKSVPENEKEDVPDQAWGRGRARLGAPRERERASWSQGSGARCEQRGGVGRELLGATGVASQGPGEEGKGVRGRGIHSQEER